MRLRLLGVAGIAVIATSVSACGDDDSSDTKRLSPAAYTAKLAALGKREDRVHADVEKAFKAKTVAEISTVIATFGAAEKRLGDDVFKIEPPADAEAANKQLADGAHQLADEISATVDSLSNATTAKQALAQVDEQLGDAAGAKKLDAALAALKKLGYTKDG
jgi:hypothetical protein